MLEPEICKTPRPARRALRAAALAFALATFGSLTVAEAQPALPAPDSAGGRVPSLDRVLAVARERAPEVVLGRADVSTARSSYAGARAPSIGNPYLEVVGERSTARGTSFANTAVTGTLWLPLEVSGQRSSRIREADALVAYRTAALGTQRALALAAAVRAYGDLVVSEERIRVLVGLLEVAESEAKNFRERSAAGDVTVRDARLAELEVARLDVQLEETRADRARAFTALDELTGAGWSEAPQASLRPPLPDNPGAVATNPGGLPAARESTAEAALHERIRERYAKESAGAVSAILLGGRGELGDARLGAGVAYAFPVTRRFQGERARAEAERSRALIEAKLRRRVIEARLRGLGRELAQIATARSRLDGSAEPTARAAVDAAVEMQRAGKGDLLPVLTSRRDLGLLELRRVDLAAREWEILAEIVAATGRLP